MRVLSIIGTRPEAIKMAPVIRCLERTLGIQSLVCSTGQHREMLDQVLELFEIQPNFNLSLMTDNQSLAGLTARLIEGLDKVVSETNPDWILAQGDTTTVLAAALVAFYQRRQFGHVEAGLRTANRHDPFPEEMNRRLADAMATVYFAPTERSRRKLLDEGCAAEAVFLTGNTVVDALLEIAGRPYDWNSGPLRGLLEHQRLVLVTAHRRESFGRPLEDICNATRDLAKRYEGAGIHFVYPVHLNPNVRDVAYRILADRPNVSLMDPLDYLSLVQLMKRCALILTDSGGIQEEAPTFSAPVLVLRNNTERPEGVEAGACRLVGTDQQRIFTEACRLLDEESDYPSMSVRVNPYGDGHASERIVAAILGEVGPESLATEVRESTHV